MNRLAASLVLAFTAAASWADTVERVVARVNRDIITKSEWDETAKAVLAQSKGKPDAAARAKIATEVLDRMISDRLIIQVAAAEGLKVTDTEVAPEVDKEVDDIRGQFKNYREFEAQLRKEGLSLEDLRARLSDRAKDRYMYWKERNRKQRELETAIDVPEEDIAAWVAEHASATGWMTETAVRARHIQFSVNPDLKGDARKAALDEAARKAAAARAALRRGDAFEDVAKQLSEDSLTKASGGDLGTFSRGSYDKSIEQAAFSLKPGEVSEPVESPVGIHLVKVEQVMKPRPKTLDEKIAIAVPQMSGGPRSGATEEITIREYVRGILRNEKMSHAFQNWVDSLRASALIQKFPEESTAK